MSVRDEDVAALHIEAEQLRAEVASLREQLRQEHLRLLMAETECTRLRAVLDWAAAVRTKTPETPDERITW